MPANEIVTQERMALRIGGALAVALSLLLDELDRVAVRIGDPR
jgi:hypothetical protein